MPLGGHARKAAALSRQQPGGLPGAQVACQEDCQTARILSGKAAEQSGNLSGGLPGCQEACQEGCQAFTRPVGKAAEQSGTLQGGLPSGENSGLAAFLGGLVYLSTYPFII